MSRVGELAGKLMSRRGSIRRRRGADRSAREHGVALLADKVCFGRWLKAVVELAG